MTNETGDTQASADAPETQLKKVIIVRRPGFRQGITFHFAGQQVQPMTVNELAAYNEGDFEPRPISEFVEMDLEIPPLNFAGLKQFTAHFQKLTGVPNVEQLGLLSDLIAYALARNYRGVPRWLIEQSLDVGNMPELTEAFMDVGGLKRKEIEQKKAQTTSGNSTGTNSTAT